MSTNQQARQQQIVAKLQRHKPLRACLCGGEAPKLGYNHGLYGPDSPKLPYPCKPGGKFEAFTLYCPCCGIRSEVFMDVQAVITAWQQMNKPKHAPTTERWMLRYEQQNPTQDQQAKVA